MELAGDQHREVRDWATFALGTISSVDTDDVREVLWERVRDEDPEVRADAIAGLARRGDERIVPVLIEDLRRGSPSDTLLEAAAEIGDVRLCPALGELSGSRR